MIGRSLRRLEDERFLTGAGRYIDDIILPGMLHAVVVRSTHAHADIASIDTSAASSMPGVRGIFTAADLAPDHLGSIPCTATVATMEPMILPPRPALAADRVRHIGEPVAFVVADSAAAARDAAEQVMVDYESLPAVIDPVAAMKPGATALWQEMPNNISYRFQKGDRAVTEAAFAQAAHVTSIELINNRLTIASMETRGAIATIEQGVMHLMLSGAGVHGIRDALADIFHVPPSSIRVSAPDVGGGFGIKNAVYPELILLLWAARRIGAPIKWVSDRAEDFASTSQGRDNHTRGRLALDSNGRFLALHVENIANLGAYVTGFGPGTSTNAPSTAMGGAYVVPAMFMDVHGVVTNTLPIDAYRGAGKPEANYLTERLIDRAARRDASRSLRNPAPQPDHRISVPQRFRHHHRLRPLPHQPGRSGTACGPSRICGAPCQPRNAPANCAASVWHALWKRRVANPTRRRRSASSRTDTSRCWWAHNRTGRGMRRPIRSLPRSASVCRLRRSAMCRRTRRLVATGGGHGGARSMHMGGTALAMAAEQVVAKARTAAARLLQTQPDTLTFADGVFSEDNGRSVSLLSVAREENLDTRAENICDLFTFPGGCHVAEVEVDPETGAVTLERYIAVDDYGRLINPLLTVGQVQGGVAQGIGQAMMEHTVYDPDSGQLLSGTFMDYAIPRAADLPDLDVTLGEVPTRANRLGVKGSGQAGAIAAPQSVMHAILDALEPLGVTHLDMPAMAESVWHAIAAARV